MLFSAIDLSQRAHLSEMMDEPCSYAEFRDCLVDLERVNRLLGGYRPSLRWLKELFRHHGGELRILDVGSGGGGMLREIADLAGKEHRAVRLTGIDLNEHAARAAREMTSPDSGIEWVTGDIFAYDPPHRVHVAMCALFTHHLGEEEIVRFLEWMESHAVMGWFINDLRRSATSYYLFKALAFTMRWHRFVKNDGPVSIRRSFIASDWVRMCEAAGIAGGDVTIHEARFGRLCVSRIKQS